MDESGVPEIGAPKDRIIFAADFRSPQEAWPWIRAIGPEVGLVKIELPLLMRGGEEFIRAIIRAGFPVFLDLKVNTIPSRGAEAAATAVYWKASLLTIQVSGGTELMAAMRERALLASQHVGLETPKLRLLGVTVSTNLTKRDLEADGSDADVRSLVVRRAELAKAAGLDGAVCSPKEAADVRQACGSNFVIVAAAIREGEGGTDDQKRTGSAYEAVFHGADYVVVGRPIIENPKPRMVIQKLASGIARAEEDRRGRKFL